MNSIWDASFIVTDVETTGSSAEKNRIFEIACVRVENGEVVSEYSSLVNPHQFIPPFISNMTGISNEKVYSAPESHKVFAEVYKFFTDKPTIFVAHNAHFDYGFINHTFKRMNLSIDDIPVLCTLKLAKRLLPKKLKMNVGALAEHFGHKISKRHRAYDDTLATVVILNELLEIAEEEYDIHTIEDLLAFQNKPIKHFKSAPPALARINEKIAELPRSPGVYYFLGKDGNILYIGKSKSLRDRVSSYFTTGEMSSKKIADLVKKVYDLTWQTVPTELEALLLESSEIKKHKPHFNSVQKKYRRYPFIRIPDGDFAYPVISRGNEEDGTLFGPFRSASFVNEILLDIEKKFKLRRCEKQLKPSPENKPCFYFHIDKCLAPCAELSTREEYQSELEKVKYYLSSISDGIIAQLEKKMLDFSDNLEFEKAQMLKSQINELRRTFLAYQNVGASISENNMIMIVPTDSRENAVDVFCIKSGKFAFGSTIGLKASISNLLSNVHSIYFNGIAASAKLTLSDIDEIKIVTSWVYKNLKNSKQIHIEDKTESEVADELMNALSQFTKKEPSRSTEYYFDDITPETFSEPL